MPHPIEIDWTATGSWMQAWAGFANAAMIGFAAFKGSQTFQSWLKQRQTERRIAVAERVLTFAYKAKDAFRAIRSPAIFHGEMVQAEEALKSEPEFLDKTDREKKFMVTAHVMLSRIDQQKPLWDELFDCLPLARSFFGVELENQVRSFWEQQSQVWASIHAYADCDGDRDFQRKCEADFWAYAGTARPGGDAVGKAIQTAFENIEARLLPVIISETR